MMPATNWRPGAVISRRLGDGNIYYGRLLDFPWAAFYRLRTAQPADASEVITHDVLFTVAAQQDLPGQDQWTVLQVLPLDGTLSPPAGQFIQDDLDPADLQIIDAAGNTRPAGYQECVGLEAAAVWEPGHIADRLMDTWAGRPNSWLQGLALIDPAGNQPTPGK